MLGAPNLYPYILSYILISLRILSYLSLFSCILLYICIYPKRDTQSCLRRCVIYTPSSVFITLTPYSIYVLFRSDAYTSNASTSVTSTSVNVTSSIAYKCSAPFWKNPYVFGESLLFLASFQTFSIFWIYATLTLCPPSLASTSHGRL